MEPSSATLSDLYPASEASKERSSQKITKRSLRPATRSTMSGRSTRSRLSTSIRRSPFAANSFSAAFTSELLPVPRAPVSSTLLAGRPATNCWVFSRRRFFCSSMSCRSEKRMLCGCFTASRYPPRAFLRQRNAVEAFQSGAALAGGSSRSSRAARSSRRSAMRETGSFISLRAENQEPVVTQRLEVRLGGDVGERLAQLVLRGEILQDLVLLAAREGAHLIGIAFGIAPRDGR